MQQNSCISRCLFGRLYCGGWRRGEDNQSDGLTAKNHLADFLYPVRGFFNDPTRSFLRNILAHSHRYRIIFYCRNGLQVSYNTVHQYNWTFHCSINFCMADLWLSESDQWWFLRIYPAMKFWRFPADKFRSKKNRKFFSLATVYSTGRRVQNKMSLESRESAIQGTILYR
jgi:hypothetical protein